ncbi:MAG: type II secretion system F family protein [Litoreibacter sp.]|nr:type II secretion system F family protein [Litoreibacter sp.]
MSGVDNIEATKSYGFSARDASGRKHSGVLNASTHLEATRQLRAKGLFPIEINAVDATSAKPAPKASKRSLFKIRPNGRMSARHQAEFVARLSKLAGAKISIDRALRIMAEGEDGPIAKAAQSLRMHVREGGGFADGLQAATRIEDAATLALVRGAETSGELDVALATAASILEQRLMVTRRIITGLLYPSLLLVVSVISVGVIMIAIIPQFVPLVENRLDGLPIMGRAVFAISGVLAGIWPLLLTAIMLGIALFGWAWHKGKAGAIISRLVNFLPVTRQLIERNHAMMALHILGALLSRNVTLSEALKVVADTTPAGRVKSAFRGVLSSVSEGEPLAASFAKTPVLAPSAVEMLRIGEETGALEDMCTRAAAEMREASDRALERFLVLFQPAMIVIVGALVGVSLYALFSAIVSVNQVAF